MATRTYNAEQWRELMATAERMRKRVSDAEEAGKPYARDPILQAVKVLCNEIDLLVAQQKSKPIGGAIHG